MKHFAPLLESLLYTSSRNAKLRLMADYFAAVPDPDRGWGLAALTGEIDLPGVKPALVRDLIARRVDPVLFDYSYDYVGDLAETVSLLWPPGEAADAQEPSLHEIVDVLRLMGRDEAGPVVARWLDSFDATERWAFLKLAMGALRVGVSARLAKTAVAALGDQSPDAVEEVWHGVAPPYAALFAWAEGRGPRPEVEDRLIFRPPMLATPIEDHALDALDPADFVAEWKWDGIRVQLVARNGECRLFSRTGEDIGGAFPDVVEAATFDAVIDGELLVHRRGETDYVAAPFNDLQQRLNRKTVMRAMLESHPAFVRAYDLLIVAGEDVRGDTFAARRARLETWFRDCAPARVDLSPILPFATWDEARGLRNDAPPAVEGLMLKRADSVYVPGRPKGPWFKWKRDPHTVDCVLMYAQRGHGKRSSFYSDYTFGVWRGEGGGEDLVPVGKAYFGFTDEELRRLDSWVRAHTVERFGPVRQVEPSLVVEVAFDAVQRSGRHKSGLAMRFPRLHRIRWDKPAAEADRLETLDALIEQ